MSATIWFAKIIKEDFFFFLSVILKLLDSISRSSLSAEPPPHERIGTGPLHLEQSGTHLHSGDSLPILAAIWGTTFLPKVWFLMSTVFVREKKNMQNCLVSALNASFKEQKKEVKLCFFFRFYDIRGKNDSDYKYTLFTKSSNSGSLRWCESSVWSPSLGNFSNRSTLQNKPKKKNTDVGGEKKMLLRYSDYRLLQPNEQTFVLSTPPITNLVLVTAEPFAISSRATFLCQALTFPSDGPVRRERSCSEGILRPAGSEARTFFNAPSGLRKKPSEKHLRVSSPACHEMPRDWFK